MDRGGESQAVAGERFAAEGFASGSMTLVYLEWSAHPFVTGDGVATILLGSTKSCFSIQGGCV